MDNNTSADCIKIRYVRTEDYTYHFADLDMIINYVELSNPLNKIELLKYLKNTKNLGFKLIKG